MSFTKLVLLLILGSTLIGCNDTGETTTSTHNTLESTYTYNTNTNTIKKQNTQKIGKYDYIKNLQQAISIFGDDYDYGININGKNMSGNYYYTWWDKGVQASYNHKTGMFRVYEIRNWEN
jgi:hypothetical protein